MSSKSNNNMVTTVKNFVGPGGDSHQKILKYKKPQTPSSRKFTVNGQKVNDEKNTSTPRTLLLKNALTQGKTPRSTLKKASSLAELTPTKTRNSSCDNSAIRASHETPSHRRQASPARIQTYKVYRGLLLNAWRRTRARFDELSESLRRQTDEIKQLEMAIRCLKELNKSEQNRGKEIIIAHQKLEKQLEDTELKSNNLTEENMSLRKQLCSMEEKLEILMNQLDNKQNIIIQKTEENKNLKLEIQNDKEALEQEVKQNMCLKHLISKQDSVIKSQLNQINECNSFLESTKDKLLQLEDLYKTQTQKYGEIEQNLVDKNKENIGLKGHVKRLTTAKTSLGTRVADLEDQLFICTRNMEELIAENENLKSAFIQFKEKPWWKDMRQISIVSFKLVAHAVYLLLPALNY